MMKIEVLKKLTEQNEAQADQVRQLLDEHQAVMINLMGSPGSGKTSLLESTLRHAGAVLKSVVLEGDLATLQDAQRIADLNVPVAQLLTEGGCHLKPGLVYSALERFKLSGVDCVFVENVGNLVCPANFDLGQHARVVVLSLPEGHDKVTKYPYMFQQADAVVLTKMDMLPLCPFDLERFRRDVAAVNPDAAVLEVSSVTKEGVSVWSEWVCRLVDRVRA